MDDLRVTTLEEFCSPLDFLRMSGSNAQSPTLGSTWEAARCRRQLSGGLGLSIRSTQDSSHCSERGNGGSSKMVARVGMLDSIGDVKDAAGTVIPRLDRHYSCPTTFSETEWLSSARSRGTDSAKEFLRMSMPG